MEEEKYRPTAEALLFDTLNEWGIKVDWNYKIFHAIYEEFMEKLAMHDYAKWVSEEEQNV